MVTIHKYETKGEVFQSRCPQVIASCTQTMESETKSLNPDKMIKTYLRQQHDKVSMVFHTIGYLFWFWPSFISPRNNKYVKEWPTYRLIKANPLTWIDSSKTLLFWNVIAFCFIWKLCAYVFYKKLRCRHLRNSGWVNLH